MFLVVNIIIIITLTTNFVNYTLTIYIRYQPNFHKDFVFLDMHALNIYISHFIIHFSKLSGNHLIINLVSYLHL